MFGKAKDPVCKIKYKKSDAVSTFKYEGKLYYFCSQQCKDEFEKKPDEYKRSEITSTQSFRNSLSVLEKLNVRSGLHTIQEKKCLWDTCRRSVKKGCVVEIGSFEGYSTILIAKSLWKKNQVIYAIDPHTGFLCESDNYTIPAGRNTYHTFLNNIRNAGVMSTVRPLKVTSEQAAKNWDASELIGVLWIDGSHRYKDVLKDFNLWHPYLALGAYIIFHDCFGPGVQKVIREEVLTNRKFGNFGFARQSIFWTQYKVSKFSDLVFKLFLLLAFNLRNRIPKQLRKFFWDCFKVI